MIALNRICMFERNPVLNTIRFHKEWRHSGHSLDRLNFKLDRERNLGTELSMIITKFAILLNNSCSTAKRVKDTNKERWHDWVMADPTALAFPVACLDLVKFAKSLACVGCLTTFMSLRNS